MELDLHERPLPQVFTGGVSVDHLSWWFWLKAGMGFTVGAGIIYIAWNVIWIFLITQAPGLLFLRAFTR